MMFDESDADMYQRPKERPFVDGPYIRMPSGRKFFLKDPPPEQWHMPDVAYRVSRIPRFTGDGYSIGQHMIVGARMARRFYPDHPMLPGRFLIHDAPESVYGDMSSPMKRCCPDYVRLLTDAERSFEKKVDMTWLDDPLTKELDTRMWLTERLVVHSAAEENGFDISEDTAWTELEPFPLTSSELRDLILPWHPELVRAIYTDDFQRHLPWVEWA